MSPPPPRLPVHDMTQAIFDLALQDASQAEIARRLGMGRFSVQRILRALVDYGALRIQGGGGRGRRVHYDRGPSAIGGLLPTLNGGVHSISPKAPPGGPQSPIANGVPDRMHHMRWAVPVFEDEMWYREHPDLPAKRWTFGLWAVPRDGKPHYKRHETRGGTGHYIFEEPTGKWEFIVWKHTMTVRAAGKKNRVADRIRIGSVVLMPHWVNVPTDKIDLEDEIEFALVMDLIREIGQNHKLTLHGLPIKVRGKNGLTEHGFPIEDSPEIPSGRTELGRPELYVDRSRPNRKPELETYDRSIVKATSLGLAALQRAPDLLARMESLERRQAMLEQELEDTKRALKEKSG